ncbi:MAG: C4-dicarboxylate transporter DctA [Proteobacteria bacterium ST_bin13]|nr:MAG: C4-dicarboxylate transporter DctA [Proteobacteria bacterium ST_bin13]
MKIDSSRTPEPSPARAWWQHLYVQVLAAIVLGALIGHVWPTTGEALKPLGDAFIKLVKMMIAPVIFLSVVSGIAGMRDIAGVGQVATKALGYFLVVSSGALFFGMAVANLVQPGRGLNIDPATLDPGAVADYVHKAHDTSVIGFLTDIIPTTLASALTDGSILQTLFVAILFGIALSLVGKPAAPVLDLVDRLGLVVFRLVAMLMRLAPIGAFGAIALTIGKFGIGTLANLGGLVATFYLTSLFFVLVVLGGIAWAHGFSVIRLIVYLRAELLLVLGTSSSEAALPSLIGKLEAAGCDRSIVGLVVPTGYSFNLDGTNIYMTLAALFIAQATNVSLSFDQQLALLGVAMLSSKGAAGVTGAGFITLAATLSIVPTVPVAGMALILGIDRFMSECRSLTNFMGNAVATIVVARWEGGLDRDRLAAVLASGQVMPLESIGNAIGEVKQ